MSCEMQGVTGRSHRSDAFVCRKCKEEEQREREREISREREEKREKRVSAKW